MTYPDTPCDHRNTGRIRIPYINPDTWEEDQIVLCARCYKDMKYELEKEEEGNDKEGH